MTDRHAPVPRSEPFAGFSLLEMLIALVVLGLLMAGLGQGLRSGLAVWSAETRHVDDQAELDTAARLLRGLLAGIVPSPNGGNGTGAGAAPAIDGTAERLSFIGDLPSGLGATSRADMTLERRRGRLMLVWRLHRRDATGGGPPPVAVETELIHGVDRMTLAYWARAVAASGSGWQAGWNRSGLPDLIRLRLDFAEGDGRRWPDLIVAPRLQAPPK